jgi:hypothetical protein
MYCSRVFRKMHIEVVWRQDGIHVLHLVLYPRYTFDLPIFGMDIVVMPGGQVSLAVVDSCPVTKNQVSPKHHQLFFRPAVHSHLLPLTPTLTLFLHTLSSGCLNTT